MVRREIMLGSDESILVDVNFDHSIVNRLDQPLAYLETIVPDEGWDGYRDSMGPLRWEIVAGQSQGAGHAALLARLETVTSVSAMSGAGISDLLLGLFCLGIRALRLDGRRG